MINSIPSSDSSTFQCSIVDEKERKKKKTIKDLTDLSTISTRTKRWRLLISERKSDRDRVTRSIELRLYPAGNLCRLPWPQSSASTLHTHHARLSAFLLTYALRDCRGREEAWLYVHYGNHRARERRTRCQHPR